MGEPQRIAESAPSAPGPAHSANPDRGHLSARDAGIVAGAAVGLQAAAWAVLYYFLFVLRFPYFFFDASDIAVYLRYASRIAAGYVPYVSFPMEYPPLVVPLLTLPGHADAPAAYFAWFAAEMALAGTLAAIVSSLTVLVYDADRRRALLTAATFAAAVVATGAIIANRYDIVVALVFAAVLLLFALRRWELAALVIGLGFALKLVPLILVPLALVLACRTRRVLASAVAFVVAGAAPFAMYAVYGMQGVRGVLLPFAYNLGRPMEIEAPFASPLLVARIFGRLPLYVENAFGGQVVRSPAADFFAGISTYVTIAAFATFYLLIWSRRGELRATPRHVPVAVLGLVLTFMLFGKALSPQYVIWLLPFAALLLAHRKLLGGALVGALLLTHVLFPLNYFGLVALEPGPVLLIAARNLLLAAAFALSARELWKLPRSPWLPVRGG